MLIADGCVRAHACACRTISRARNSACLHSSPYTHLHRYHTYPPPKHTHTSEQGEGMQAMEGWHRLVASLIWCCVCRCFGNSACAFRGGREAGGEAGRKESRHTEGVRKYSLPAPPHTQSNPPSFPHEHLQVGDSGFEPIEMSQVLLSGLHLVIQAQRFPTVRDDSATVTADLALTRSRSLDASLADL